MDNRRKVIDCDVFCTEDFEFYGDVTITGNFYASANVNVRTLNVGGDIYLISKDDDNTIRINAKAVNCNGIITMRNYGYCFGSMCAGEHVSIDFSGPVLRKH